MDDGKSNPELPLQMEDSGVAAWTPANGVGEPDEDPGRTSPDLNSGDLKSPPAKRRREDRERSRVSRACDRCKK